MLYELPLQLSYMMYYVGTLYYLLPSWKQSVIVSVYHT